MATSNSSIAFLMPVLMHHGGCKECLECYDWYLCSLLSDKLHWTQFTMEMNEDTISNQTINLALHFARLRTGFRKLTCDMCYLGETEWLSPICTIYHAFYWCRKIVWKVFSLIRSYIFASFQFRRSTTVSSPQN